jgi:peptidoglycan/LPS O-acetylase OafA/YrhL
MKPKRKILTSRRTVFLVRCCLTYSGILTLFVIGVMVGYGFATASPDQITLFLLILILTIAASLVLAFLLYKHNKKAFQDYMQAMDNLEIMIQRLQAMRDNIDE